jgi:hypothetical protein
VLPSRLAYVLCDIKSAGNFMIILTISGQELRENLQVRNRPWLTVRTTETSVYFKGNTLRCIPEGCHFHIRCSQNLIFNLK